MTQALYFATPLLYTAVIIIETFKTTKFIPFST